MSTIINRRSLKAGFASSIATALVLSASVLQGAQAPAPAKAATATAPASQGTQKIDADYTKRIVDNVPDKRLVTDLAGHMPLPLDPKIPSPLKFLGYVPGENGQLTYHKDVVRYLDALQKASPRVKMWNIGKTEEGREMVAVAIADEATIRNLQHYKDITAQLTDPRKTSETVAAQLIKTGKPIYYASGSIHTPETGSVEMLMELAYRLAIEETPFIKDIRNNVITVLTPASEVDGREKQVDNQRARQAGQPAPGLAYWGHYVQHDNNRDGIGKGLALTNNMLKSFFDLHPTVFHDLHESEPLLYVSTGTGPYNPAIAPVQVTEWWQLAQHEIQEMTKKGVPGVWTYDYYDGWVPNYMFWIGVTHNSIGRFYETQSYGGGNGVTDATGKVIGVDAANAAAAARAGGAAPAAGGGGRGGGRGGNANAPAAAQAGRGGGRGVPAQEKEWYRVNPIPPEGVVWSGRSNINMQETALLTTLNYVAKNKEMFLENYYAKNKMMIEEGKTRAPYAYVVPAGQHRVAEVVDFMNFLKRDGVEIHRASAPFKAGNVDVATGDFVVRMDQPYRGVVENLLGVQWYPADNPRPYDDTGWNAPILRNVKSIRVDDKGVLDKPMTLVTAAQMPLPGMLSGTGATIVIDNTTDNTLTTFAYANKTAKISIAEAAFDLGGHHFSAGSFIVANANRAALEPQIKDLGLQAWAVGAAPSVAMHDLTPARIGYIHSWGSTQDEGWWRLALDHLKIPYEYFGDNKVRQGNLRAKYDVILYPHTGSVVTNTTGMPTTGDKTPYMKTDVTPNIGTSPDNTDDTRGGLGADGLAELVKFVNEGGVLITEGTPARLFPQFQVTQGVTLETPAQQIYAQGSVLKTMVDDPTSPILYGFDQKSLGVLFNVGPLFGPGKVSLQPAGEIRPGGGSLAPMSAAPQLTTLDDGAWTVPPGAIGIGTGGGARGLGGAGGGGPGSGFGAGGRGGRGGGAGEAPAGPTGKSMGVTSTAAPRVLLSFPNETKDMLLSGELTNGEYLAGHPALIDAQVGKGHALLFGFRPFWRYETSGNYPLVFNALLNWNHLDAGKK